MKKLAFLLLLISAAITGCEKDDSSNNPATDIVGKWYIEKSVETEYENGVKVDEDTKTSFTAYDYFEFKANGTAVFSEDGGPDPADIDDYTYVINGNTVILTLVGSNDVLNAEITKLTSGKLILFADDTDVYQGITYRYTSELTMHK